LANASLLSPLSEHAPIATGEPSELSIFQEQIWLDEQITPGRSVYNVPIAIHLQGTLDVDILELSLNEIARRHEILRATFPTVSHRPVQVVRDDAATLSIVEVTDGSPSDRLERVKSACEEEARRPFDLPRGPIIRLILYRLSPIEHVLLVVVHHLAFDGWSIGLFVQELASLYSAYWGGQPSPLPDLPIRYADFARDQRLRLSGAVLDGLVAFWRGYLEGAPPHLALPFDHPPSSGRTYRGARHPLELDEELTAALKSFSQAEGVTVFMTLLATLATLVYRYTGQADVVIGTPIAQRRSPKTRALFGDFANTVVMRTDVSGGPSFRELIARSRRSAMDAYAHQELPYNMLVSALNPERDPSGSSLVQVMLSLQNTPLPAVEMAGLSTEIIQTCTGRALCTERAWYDLTVELLEQPGRLIGWLEYDRDLFDAATIARMAGHFERLLEAAVAEPDRSVAELPLLTEDERRQVVETWNDTRVDYPLDTCLHELCEAQVERTPDAIALVFEHEALSYCELNARANRLAHSLQSLGVGPDTLVGLCLERSVEMVVGLLAVLKAGGAYVPLDPEYPSERLEFMMADCDAPVLLTQRRYASRLAASRRALICLDEVGRELTEAPAANPMRTVGPENLAYVIYTSGSTGRPKGAMNTHRGIVNRLLWMQDAYRLGAGDRVLQKTPFSFDVSVWEFFWPILTGATLVVARPGGHRDPVYLGHVIAQRGITNLHFVPPMLQEFVERVDAQTCHGLRRVICSGEALPFDLQERFFERFPGVELHNLYGPTEAAVDVSFWACRRGEGANGVPIGRPIANTQLYVLDSRMAPVPIGVPGELYIGGVGVGTGYWRRTELTNERFVLNPVGERRSRVYRTGDLARWRADGNIEYLGRLDHQVKIRGHRIELGEIESALLRHPAVAESVVVARQHKPGQARLVAYVTPAADLTRPAAAELRSHLAGILPEYMVPSAFVVLETLPLTPNGKVDRSALPVPELDRGDSGEQFTPPRTQTEWELARIWCKVLAHNEVGIHDNFFHLGGDSLLANQVISRMNERFAVQLPLRGIFESPTIAGLARAIEGEGHSEMRESIRLLKPGGPGPALFLVHDGFGDTLLYNKLAQRMPDKVKVYGIDPRATGFCPMLHTRIIDMAAYYVQQVRQVQPEGPYCLGSLCAGGMIAFEMALQLEAQGFPVGFVALLDAPGPALQTKEWLRYERSLARFGAALRSGEGQSRFERLRDRAAKAGRKATNFLKYETTVRAQRLVAAVRFQLLRAVLDRGRSVPRFLQGMSAATVLSFARKSYAPNRLLESKAVLFRPTVGTGNDEPVMNLSLDPLLDWGGRVKGNLVVIDTPGGHSTMIQEPYVDEMANHLKALMDEAGGGRLPLERQDRNFARPSED
jgi:amino acid adenylation domain-containing protein